MSDARPAAARPTTAILALGVALVAAVAGAIVVRRAARHMPPLPPAGAQAPQAAPTPGGASAGRAPAGAPRAGAGGGARPEYPRLQ